MIVAKEKRRSNIAEYVLYMWHIEDIIRVYKLDIELIEKNIVTNYKLDLTQQKEIRDWYESLIQMMKENNIEKKGHLPLVMNTVKQMEELHKLLLNSTEEFQYKSFYYTARPHIITFQSKFPEKYLGEIHICLEAMYMLLMMRLAKKEIHTSTQESTDTFSRLLALLSQKFVYWENGELDL